jgi:hypothetical protein
MFGWSTFLRVRFSWRIGRLHSVGLCLFGFVCVLQTNVTQNNTTHKTYTHIYMNIYINLYIFIYIYIYIYIIFKVHCRRRSEAISIFLLPRDTLLVWKFFTFPVLRGIGSISNFFSSSAAWY